MRKATTTWAVITGVDAGHGEIGQRAARCGRSDNASSVAHLSRGFAAGRRRLLPELLDRRSAVLARHSARRSGIPSAPGVAFVEERRTREFPAIRDGASRLCLPYSRRA